MLRKVFGLKKDQLSEQLGYLIMNYVVYFVNIILLELRNPVPSMLVFWVVMSHGLVGRYKCFRGMYCLHQSSKAPKLC